MKVNNQSKIISGSKWSLLFSVISIFTQILSVLVLSRIYNADDFGMLALAIMILEFLKGFNYLFILKSIVIKKDVTTEFIGTASTLSLVNCLISIGGLYFLKNTIAGFFSKSGISEMSFWFIAVVLFLNGIYRPLKAKREADLNFKSIQKADILIVSFTTLVQILLAVLLRDVYVLFVGILLMEVFRLVYFLSREKLRFSFELKFAKEIYQDSFHIIGIDLANKFAVQGDNLVISRYLDITSLGIYSRAYKLMKIPTILLSNVFNQIAFPAFTKVDIESTKSLYFKINFLLAFLTFPLIAIVFLFFKEIVFIILGPNWDNVGIPFLIFGIGIYLRLFYKLPVSILQANGKFKEVMHSQILYAAAVILLAFGLKEYGVNGIALGTLIALFINFFFLAFLTHKFLDLRLKDFLISFTRPIFLFISVLLLGFIIKCVGSYLNVFYFGSFIITLIFIFIITFYLFKNQKLLLLGSDGVWWLNKLTSK